MGEIFKTITREELQHIIKEHSVWLKSMGMKGTRANLSSIALVRTDLSHLDLSFVDFTYANLIEINCTNSNFSRTDFTGTNMSYVNFTDANLSYAKLHNVKMVGIKTEGCRLYNVSVTHDVYRNNRKLFNTVRNCVVV